MDLKGVNVIKMIANYSVTVDLYDITNKGITYIATEYLPPVFIHKISKRKESYFFKCFTH